MGIDLPLKALSWQDGTGQVWLAYNDPDWIARRHGLDGAAENSIPTILQSLTDVTLRLFTRDLLRRGASVM
jgi:uncharacterized protein (DUF302 family)